MQRNARALGGDPVCSFAATGDPDTAGLPRWHRAPYVQGLDLGRGGIAPFDRAAAHRLALWVELSDF